MTLRRTACAVLVLALLAPAAAEARFGETQTFQQPAAYGQDSFVLDGNARGDRVVVWTAGDGFAFARARPGEPFGPARVLPRERGDLPYNLALELDERGNAVFVWTYDDGTEPAEPDLRDSGCCNGLRARIIRADGSFSGVKHIVRAGTIAELAALHVNRAGRFGILFRTAGPRFDDPASIQVRLGTTRKGFGGRERLPIAPGRIDPLAHRIALSFVRGRARVLFARPVSERRNLAEPQVTALRELQRVRAGRWRGLASAARARLIPSSVQLSTASNGRQAAVWHTESASRPSLVAAIRSPGRRFRTSRLGAARLLYAGISRPAIDASGNALVVWASRRGLMAASARPGRPFGRPGAIRPAARFQPYPPAFAVDSRGRQLVALSEARATVRLLGLFRSPRGAVTERAVLEEGAAAAPQVALDRRGRGTVAYVWGGEMRLVPARAGG